MSDLPSHEETGLVEKEERGVTQMTGGLEWKKMGEKADKLSQDQTRSEALLCLDISNKVSFQTYDSNTRDNFRRER